MSMLGLGVSIACAGFGISVSAAGMVQVWANMEPIRNSREQSGTHLSPFSRIDFFQKNPKPKTLNSKDPADTPTPPYGPCPSL